MLMSSAFIMDQNLVSKFSLNLLIFDQQFYSRELDKGNNMEKETNYIP